MSKERSKNRVPGKTIPKKRTPKPKKTPIKKEETTEEVKIKEVTPVEPKIEETKEEQIVEELEKKPEPESPVTETKTEKKKNFFDEVKSFFIIALIIALVAFGCWCWYKHMDKEEKPVENKEEKVINNYKYISYKVDPDNTLKVLNNEYVIEYQRDSLAKVMDINLNLIYENEGTYTDCFIGLDNNLYFYTFVENYEDEFPSNKIALYKYEDGEIKEFIDLADDMVYYRMITTGTYNNEKVLGYIGTYDGYDENGERLHTESVYLLTGQKYELKDMYLISDEPALDATEPFYLKSSHYAIFKQNDAYGVLDLLENKIIINPIYEDLHTSNNDTYIAVKENKTGIVDLDLKKLVNFEYDFIDSHEDFYVVSVNNKLGILKNDYTPLTGLIFDYQKTEDVNFSYHECCGNYNAFEAYQVKDKVLLIINGKEKDRYAPFTKHEAYVISPDGTFKTITEYGMYVDLDNEIIYAYDKDNNNHIFYDLDFNEKFKLNFDSYDNSANVYFDYFYDTIIASGIASPLYYDKNSGESIPNALDYSYKFDNVELKYIGKTNQVELYIDNKKVSEFTYDISDLSNTPLYNKLSDNSFYYCDTNNYLMVKKDE